MRKNQAAQSIALAVGLVGGLGFLGYTMLGDMLVGDPTRGEQVALDSTHQRQAKGVVTRTAMPSAARPIPAAAVIAAPQESAVSPTTAVALPATVVGAAAVAAAVSQANPAPAVGAPMHAATAVASLPPSTTTYSAPRAVPVQQAVQMAPPPAPIQPMAAPVFPSALESPSAAPQTKRGLKRRRAREVRVADIRVAPAVAKNTQMRSFEPAMPATKTPPVAVAAPVLPVAAAPAPAPVERRPAAAVPASSVFASKDDMAVTISGQKAWVQVSPTRTMEAKKGDVLPNLGRILEIRGNQVVAEKGTLTTN